MVNWEQLISKQLKSSQLIKRLSKIESTYALNPCITVSREPSCRGRLIAQEVAKALKINLYDKELVDLIAKTAKKGSQNPVISVIRAWKLTGATPLI